MKIREFREVNEAVIREDRARNEAAITSFIGQTLSIDALETIIEDRKQREIDYLQKILSGDWY